MQSRSDPNELLRDFFRRERQKDARHPSPEQIAAYQERRLSPGEAEEVRAHLAACPDCTAELLELTALLEAEGVPDAGASRAQLDASWQRQRRRLPPDRAIPTVARRTSAPLRRAWATAASLGVAAMLLMFLALAQWRTIARLQQPQANPPLLNLAPSGSLRQGLPAVPDLRLPEDAARAWVILNPVAELDFPSYDVEVIAPGGAVAVRFEGLRSSEAGNFRLELPRAVLRAGRYRLLLFGKKAGQRHLICEFALRVSLAPSLP
jgi:Putative zinc-finger